MRSDKEVAREALRRGEIIRKRKAEKTRRVHALCSIAACLVLIIGLSFILPAVNGGVTVPKGLYDAALFADSSTGGYILMGVIGFVLGAVIVLLYKRNRKG